jgi:uncharacterized protein YjbI with pentapeptide repeats
MFETQGVFAHLVTHDLTATADQNSNRAQLGSLIFQSISPGIICDSGDEDASAPHHTELLYEAWMKGADFRYVDLQGMNLGNAKLPKSIFEYANLTEANCLAARAATEFAT